MLVCIVTRADAIGIEEGDVGIQIQQGIFIASIADVPADPCYRCHSTLASAALRALALLTGTALKIQCYRHVRVKVADTRTV